MNQKEMAVVEALDRACQSADAAQASITATGAAMVAAFGTPGTVDAQKKFEAFRKAHLQVSQGSSINDLMTANKGKAFDTLDADGKQARRNRCASSTWSNLKPTSARAKAKAKAGKAKAGKAKAGKAKAKSDGLSVTQIADNPSEARRLIKAMEVRIQSQKDSPYADQLAAVAALQVAYQKLAPKAKAKAK